MDGKRTVSHIPKGWMATHFPACICCGEVCMYPGGVHPEVAICGKCAEKELARRRELK